MFSQRKSLCGNKTLVTKEIKGKMFPPFLNKTDVTFKKEKIYRIDALLKLPRFRYFKIKRNCVKKLNGQQLKGL